jgi:ABC-type glycerol-3-phosphate transport system substrate-binding protein
MSSRRMIVVHLVVFFSMLCVSDVTLFGDTRSFVLVVRMMEMQDRWFRENIIPPFEKKYNAKVTVVSFDKFWDLEVMLRLERDRGRHTIGLVKTPLEMTRPLRGFMTPYDSIMGKGRLRRLRSQYNSHALRLGTIGGKLYYLPRKLETRIMVYLKSKAAEAVRGWKGFKPAIDSALRRDNGFGLPAGYRLEADPNRWDYYDIFVVSYYWANTPYYGIKLPRMAHRGKKYGGTVVGLVDRIFQMGGASRDVLRMSSDPVIDMFVWEAIYRKNGLYNPGMWQDPWSGGGIWNAMKDGKVFLAMMHQIDSFFIHGGTHPQMQGYLADPNDMGVALMPRGVSFALNRRGRPVRRGSRKAGTAGWWWGIPRSAPHPELSLELAKWITSYKNHFAECRVFGMMPVRRDILGNLKRAFPGDWMANVFDISIKQIGINGNTTVPLLPEYSSVGKIYLDAWYNIVVRENYGRGGRIERDYIRKRLHGFYVPKIKGILRDSYPE